MKRVVRCYAVRDASERASEREREESERGSLLHRIEKPNCDGTDDGAQAGRWAGGRAHISTHLTLDRSGAQLAAWLAARQAFRLNRLAHGGGGDYGRTDAHLHKTIIRIWTDYRSAGRSVGL